MRPVIYLHYNDVFASLSSEDIVFSFINGLRFDCSANIKLIGIPLLLLFLPFAWARTKVWQGLWSWYIYAALVATTFLLISNFIYFGFTDRHVGPEIGLIFADTELMLDMLFNEHGLSVALFTLATIGGGVLWHHCFKTPLQPPSSTTKHLVAVLILFLVLAILGRGVIQGRPIGIADAFTLGNSASGYLTMNGVFSSQYSLTKPLPGPFNYTDKDQATQTVRDIFIQNGDQLSSPQFPLMRSTPSSFPSSTPPNVVVLMIESLDAEHVDALRTARGKTTLGITPSLDALSEKGLLFTQFYANGRRSLEGLAATLTGIPTPPNMPYIGQGMEQNQLPYLANLANQENYQTFFIESSTKGSFRIDSVAKTSGFNHYYGAEDIPVTPNHGTHKAVRGAWDYDALMFANSLFAQEHQKQHPFFGFIFTSTTHNPWRVPGKQWEILPPDNGQNSYKNTVNYIDWALGEFISEAKKAGYYDNTVFIITGDHIGRYRSAVDIKSRYHIPLLILGPMVQPGISTNLGCQLDLLPTIADLAGWEISHASLGYSLMSEQKPNKGIYAVNGDIIEWIGANGAVSHNLQQRVETQPDHEHSNLDELEQRLLTTHQVLMDMSMSNKIIHSH